MGHQQSLVAAAMSMARPGSGGRSFLSRARLIAGGLIYLNAGASGHEESGMSAMAGCLEFLCSDLHMTDHSNKIEPVRSSVQRPRDELIVFVIIVAIVWPVVTVGMVGGYGFAVSMYQVVAGPPGPPKR